MKASCTLLALVAGGANAAYQGFNYANQFTDSSAKFEADFEAEFSAAASLTGTKGAFNSARLYTMIQAYTTADPISAIPAAIKTKTSLLLGMWATGGDAAFENELSALKTAIEKYGDDFASLVAGISVGSEDLYRITPTGIENGEYDGANPEVLAKYVKQVRDAISGTTLSAAKIGHVDTWTAWANSSNKVLIDSIDWVGMDAYPYFEKENDNDISNGKKLFQQAIDNTNGGTGGKELWITETGWPISGKTIGKGVANKDNAKKFWDSVGCPMFGVTNVWWYTFQDSAPDTPNPSFGVIGNDLKSEPVFDLSCDNIEKEPEQSATSSKSETKTSDASKSSSTGGSDKDGEEGLSGGNDSSTPVGGSTDTNSNSTSSPNPSSGGDSGINSTGGNGESNSDSGSGTTGQNATTTGGPTINTNSAVGLGRSSFGAGVMAILAAVLAL